MGVTREEKVAQYVDMLNSLLAARQDRFGLHEDRSVILALMRRSASRMSAETRQATHLVIWTDFSDSDPDVIAATKAMRPPFDDVA